MKICMCEIEQKWPTSCQARYDMLHELEKRGLLESRMVNQHGRMERVWDTVRVRTY